MSWLSSIRRARRGAHERDLIATGLVLLATATLGCSRGSAARGEARPPNSTTAAAIEPIPEAPPSLKKVVPAPTPPWAPSDPAWSYVLPLDYGIRADSGGSGYFLAPRKHGKHNGVDFLAPVGTPTLAICNGKARMAMKGGYGRTVQLVCKLPDDLGGDDGLYVSFLYGHLDKAAVSEKWTSVHAGAKVGWVGKSGNAAGPEIKPHLHLEAIIRASEDDAKGEKHAGVDAKAGALADPFFEALHDECLQPAHFASNAGMRRERRADPFVLMMCAAKPKPDLTTPSDAGLGEGAVRWSERYTALGFDVDSGPRNIVKAEDEHARTVAKTP